VLPPVALLLASSILARTSEWQSRDGRRVRPRPNRSVVVGCAIGGLVLVGMAVLLYRAGPLFLNVAPTLRVVVAALIGASGAAVVIVSMTGAWRAGPGALAFATAVSFAALPYAALSAPADSTVKQIATRIRDARTSDESLATSKVFVRNLVFYTGVKHTDLIHDEHLVEWLGKNPKGLIVMPLAEADRLEQLGSLEIQRLAQLPYFDDGSIRVRTLARPDPAQDLQQVVIVRIRRR
jgi:hypothetical protein